MTVEADLYTLLSGLGVPSFPDVCEGVAPASYTTFRAIGGPSWRYVDNSAAPQRWIQVQINAWATTRLAAKALIRQVEDAMSAAGAFNAQPVGEPIDVTEDTNPRSYGCIQDFDIQAAR